MLTKHHRPRVSLLCINRDDQGLQKWGDLSPPGFFLGRYWVLALPVVYPRLSDWWAENKVNALLESAKITLVKQNFIKWF